MRRPLSRSCSHRRVRLDQLLAAPHVVHEQVQPAALLVDPPDQRLHLIRLEMVDDCSDAFAAGGRHELGGLLDRLRAVVLRPPPRGRASGAVNGRAHLSERDGRPAAGAARGPRDEGHLAVKWPRFVHGSVHLQDHAACPNGVRR
jgi:hypothetical protein